MKAWNPFFCGKESYESNSVLHTVLFNILDKYVQDRLSHNFSYEPFSFDNTEIEGAASAIISFWKPEEHGNQIAVTIFPQHIIEKQGGGIRLVVHKVDVNPQKSTEYEMLYAYLDREVNDKIKFKTLISSLMIDKWDWEKSQAKSVGKRKPSLTVIPVKEISEKKRAARSSGGPKRKTKKELAKEWLNTDNLPEITVDKLGLGDWSLSMAQTVKEEGLFLVKPS